MAENKIAPGIMAELVEKDSPTDTAELVDAKHAKSIDELGYKPSVEQESSPLKQVTGEKIIDIVKGVTERGSTYQDAAKLILHECGIDSEERIAGGASNMAFQAELQGKGTQFKIVKNEQNKLVLMGTGKTGELPVSTYLARYASAPAGAGYMDTLANWINKSVEAYDSSQK